MRDAAGEFDDLQPALDVALGISDDLAVLRRQQMGELLHIMFEQALEFEHHPGAALGIGCRPVDLRGSGGFNRPVQLSHGPEANPGLDGTGIRIKHVAISTRRRRQGGSGNEMVDLADGGHAGTS